MTTISSCSPDEIHADVSAQNVPAEVHFVIFSAVSDERRIADVQGCGVFVYPVEDT